jgi:hypothetical protein
MKIDVVLHSDHYSCFDAAHLETLFLKYFNCIRYDPLTSYDNRTLFIANVFKKDAWTEQLIEEDRKVVVDSLWETADVAALWKPTYILSCPNWFWYNESLWYSDLGYDHYNVNKTYSKLAFMPINRVKTFRDTVVDKLDSYLDNFIYSYKEHKLPGDTQQDNMWQRYFNPDWYNDTYFSLVVETLEKGPCFITEKTFKPCAFKHPFMVYGQAGTLNFIKKLGFVTYENLFDESYDQFEMSQRLEKIIDNIKDFKQIAYDAPTLEKIEHNYSRFFDRQLVTDRFTQEIINPLIEYAET